MAFTMDAAVVRSYENAAIMLVQQMVSRMKDKVRLVSGLKSTSHSFNRHGVQVLVENQNRNADTAYTDSPWTRRVVGPRRFNGAELIDQLDALQALRAAGGDARIAKCLLYGQTIYDTGRINEWGTAVTR